ncbi:hypothetical protein IWZ00DRAFT_513284 [Phyllosticta capitalensis]
MKLLFVYDLFFGLLSSHGNSRRVRVLLVASWCVCLRVFADLFTMRIHRPTSPIRRKFFLGLRDYAFLLAATRQAN